MAFALPDSTIEQRLLMRARRGDQDAIGEIYDAFFASIYQYVRLRVEDQQLAEDITGEVFVRLVDSIGTRRGPRENLRGWLFRVARNEVYRHYGRARQLPTMTLEDWLPAGEGDDLEVDFIRSVTIERTRQVLRMLPGEQQEVLILRFGEGLDLQETADIMGKSVGAIKSLQFRAVETLRRILGDVRGVSSYG